MTGVNRSGIREILAVEPLYEESKETVAVFPSVESYIRLDTAHLIEYAEEWSTSRAYVHPKDIEDQEGDLNKAP